MVKFILLIFYSLTLFLTSNLIKIYFLLFVILLLHYFGKFPYETAKPKYKMLVVFSFMIFIVQAIFNDEGVFLFHLIPFRIGELGPLIPIHSIGLIHGLLLIGRFLGLVSISWIFVNSTNPFDFAQSLTKFRVPYRFAYTLSLALRFSPVLSLETQIVQDAQSARGLNVSTNPRGILNTLRYTLLPLISSTLNRIRDITLSMEGRAFGYYQQRTYVREIPLRYIDIMTLLLISIMFGLLILV